MNPIVSVTRCDSYDHAVFKRAVVKLLKPLGGLKRYVRRGARVLLKPNFLSAKPPHSCVTTHPALIRALVELVAEAGGRPSLGDAPALVGPGAVCRVLGLSDYLRRHGVAVRKFRQSRCYSAPQGSAWLQHRLHADFEDFDCVINLPKLKTHAMMILTLAVKNIFGFSPQAERLSWHFRAGVDREMFAEMLVDACLIVKPSLSICDAVWGMEGEGPGSGTPVKLDFLAASADAFALDDAISGLLGLKRPIHTTRIACRRGVYKGRFRQMGMRKGEKVVGSFALPRSLEAGDLGIGVPRPLRGLVHRYMTDRPLVTASLCDACGNCRKICPAGAVTIVSDGGAHIDQKACLRCYCCQEVCPRGAIKIRHSRLLRLLNKLM